MRLAAVILVWVVILGGLALYMRTRQHLTPQENTGYVIQPAPGKFTLELTPTFEARGGVNDFALEPVEQAAFVLSLGGKEIVSYAQTMPAGVPQEITWDTEQHPLVLEKNEFHIRTTTTPEDISMIHGMRLRLLRDGEEIDRHTLWSQPGRPVEGVFPIYLEGSAESEHADAHNN